MKYHVVFAAVHHNLALITRETLQQRSGAFHRCEPAADNYDLGSIHGRPASASALDLLPCVSRRVPTVAPAANETLPNLRDVRYRFSSTRFYHSGRRMPLSILTVLALHPVRCSQIRGRRTFFLRPQRR